MRIRELGHINPFGTDNKVCVRLLLIFWVLHSFLKLFTHAHTHVV